MFTILPEEGGWNLLARLTEVRLNVTCWCEHPDGPHPGAPIGSGLPPDYLLKMPKDWVVKAAPYISWAAMLFKAFVPLAGTVVEQGLSGAMPDGLKEKIDLMRAISGAVPSGKLETGEPAQFGSGHGIRPEIVALGHIHDALLAQVPEGKRWGDLRPVRTKGGDLLWLCAKHAEIQQPSPQKI